MLKQWQRSMTIAIAYTIKCTFQTDIYACTAITLKLDGFTCQHFLPSKFSINDIITEERRIMKKHANRCKNYRGENNEKTRFR